MTPPFDTLAQTIKLPPDEWAAIAEQAARLAQVVATLQELPLEGVTPAALHPTNPASQRSQP